MMKQMWSQGRKKVDFYLNDLIVQMVKEQDDEKVALIAEIEGL